MRARRGKRKTGNPPVDSGHKTSSGSNRILKLTRHAEQLNEIEQTLIRKIGTTHITDRDTDALICQLQIATNRIISQLKEMREESESVPR